MLLQKVIICIPHPLWTQGHFAPELNPQIHPSVCPSVCPSAHLFLDSVSVCSPGWVELLVRLTWAHRDPCPFTYWDVRMCARSPAAMFLLVALSLLNPASFASPDHCLVTCFSENFEIWLFSLCSYCWDRKSYTCWSFVLIFFSLCFLLEDNGRGSLTGERKL